MKHFDAHSADLKHTV